MVALVAVTKGTCGLARWSHLQRWRRQQRLAWHVPHRPAVSLLINFLFRRAVRCVLPTEPCLLFI